MMLKKKLFVLFLAVISLGVACKKEDYDPVVQLAKDDQAIKEFIAKNNIPAEKLPSGVYIQIITPGSGSETITTTSYLSVNYEGRLLNGSVFDKSSGPATFRLNTLITGWQYGLIESNVKKGARVRLIIPSTLAYMNQSRVGIPKNSPLDFTIDILNIQ
ncbi:MAG: peptidylprolyl isomerase [Pedobacter sp.]|nr:MAG: peptidylprolyl isomerase [Pedobacter sp.]